MADFTQYLALLPKVSIFPREKWVQVARWEFSKGRSTQESKKYVQVCDSLQPWAVLHDFHINFKDQRGKLFCTNMFI